MCIFYVCLFLLFGFFGGLFRRPEITIVSAEPLAGNSWFSGTSVVFPPPLPQSGWSSGIQAVSLVGFILLIVFDFTYLFFSSVNNSWFLIKVTIKIRVLGSLPYKCFFFIKKKKGGKQCRSVNTIFLFQTMMSRNKIFYHWKWNLKNREFFIHLFQKP